MLHDALGMPFHFETPAARIRTKSQGLRRHACRRRGEGARGGRASEPRNARSISRMDARRRTPA